MSRSRREPYYENSDGSKWWKKQFNKRVRQDLSDYVDGNFFKKINEVWSSPMEHKHAYWDEPRMRRK